MRSRLVALVAAAVLGAGGGVVTALATDEPAREAPATGRPEPGVVDPLGLGVPLTDLGCTGEAVLVVAVGESASPLRAALADLGPASGAGGSHRPAAYLRPDRSCATRFAPEDRPVPEYVAYLGPFDDLAEPCERRMTLAHKGDNVTVLTEGTTDFVRCVCVLPTAAMPELRLGTAVDPELGIWIRALQGMLVDVDDGRFTEEQVSGRYDEPTAARLASLQAYHDIEPGSPVGETTWRALRDRACGGYDF